MTAPSVTTDCTRCRCRRMWCGAGIRAEQGYTTEISGIDDIPTLRCPPHRPSLREGVMSSDLRQTHTVPADPPTAVPPAGPAGPPAASPATRVPRTRTGAGWFGICVAALLFVVFIVFMLQNTRSVQVNFLGMHGSLPLAASSLVDSHADRAAFRRLTPVRRRRAGEDRRGGAAASTPAARARESFTPTPFWPVRAPSARRSP
jgi:hypothetical protein